MSQHIISNIHVYDWSPSNCIHLLYHYLGLLMNQKYVSADSIEIVGTLMEKVGQPTEVEFRYLVSLIN